MEKFSVLMSLYKNDQPQFLARALDSVLGQDPAPDEIVLVEDGPLTEGLYGVVDGYVKKYPGVFNIAVNEKNLGLGPALEKGLAACKNELVARMDSDDVCLPGRFASQLKVMRNDASLSVVGGQIEEFVDSEDNIVGKRTVPCEDAQIKDYLKKRCPFNHVTVMLRKSDVMEVGNYLEWPWNEDYYLWVRLAEADKKFANLPDTLVRVRTGSDMYRRRGGPAYFKSEKNIQKLMRSKGMISVPRYFINVTERFILQVLMPNRLRGFIFRRLAREH